MVISSKIPVFVVETKIITIWKANAEYQARIVELSRRKRENAMRIRASGSRPQAAAGSSATMRKLNFFQKQMPEVDHEVRH